MRNEYNSIFKTLFQALRLMQNIVAMFKRYGRLGYQKMKVMSLMYTFHGK